MRGERMLLKNLKQLKDYLNLLEEDKPIEFKTLDGKKFEFYGFAHGGVISNETTSAEIIQSLIFKLVD